MVKNTGTKNGISAIRSLNAPEAIEVKENRTGNPSNVRLGKEWLSVKAVQDVWRIDDEWWRAEPISRLYFTLTLKDGTIATVFKDLVSHAWFKQPG